VRDATTAAIGDGRGLFQFPRMENGNIRMNANWAGRSDRIFLLLDHRSEMGKLIIGQKM